MSSAEPILLSLSEVRVALGSVSRATVWRLCRDEGLPHVKLGRRVLFPRAQLEEWIQARVVGPAAA